MNTGARKFAAWALIAALLCPAGVCHSMGAPSARKRAESTHCPCGLVKPGANAPASAPAKPPGKCCCQDRAPSAERRQAAARPDRFAAFVGAEVAAARPPRGETPARAARRHAERVGREHALQSLLCAWRC